MLIANLPTAIDFDWYVDESSIDGDGSYYFAVGGGEQEEPTPRDFVGVIFSRHEDFSDSEDEYVQAARNNFNAGGISYGLYFLDIPPGDFELWITFYGTDANGARHGYTTPQRIRDAVVTEPVEPPEVAAPTFDRYTRLRYKGKNQNAPTRSFPI